METNDINDLDKLISLEKWSEALLIFEKKKKTTTLAQNELMKLGLIHFNLNQHDLGFSIFKNLTWDNYTDCAWLRRLIISPLIKAQHFIWAGKLLELIVNTHPNSILDLTTLSSVLIRQNKRLEGSIYLEKILAIEKNNYNVAAQLIQLHLQANNLEKAASLAESYEHGYSVNERLLKVAFLALSRVGNFKLCMKYIAKINFSEQPIDLGIKAAQIAYDGKDYSLAENITKQLLILDSNDVRINLLSAKIKLVSGENEEEAIAALVKAGEIDPENIQVNNLLGDLLLRKGNYTESLQYLNKLKNFYQKILIPVYSMLEH
ncbi:tetratricopeptide repeat protein (plasmid) [Legionella sp. D16C41]|uniref:tetratricopeptide repeat protein n=1 Tax=Legionella sp. D16C41 TaxID=3402688 RepID=UPI003AF74019